MNREKLMEAFETYAAGYNLEDPNIRLKYIHTGKVAQNCETIAVSLNLPKEDCDLAWAIGMLHDIGRFEQLRRFDTFNDAVSIDHARFGADLLFKEGLAQRFLDEEDDRDIIEKAVRFHSMYRVPDGLTDREKMFCDIIRDADKVDIFRANYDTGIDVVYHVTKEQLRRAAVTPEVFEVFLEERAIPRNIRRTVADNLVGHMALNFELVYPKSRELAKSQGYVWKLLDTEFENEETVKIMGIIRSKLEAWFGKN